MNKKVKWFFGALMLLIFLFALAFLTRGGDLVLNKFFGAKEESVKREIFEQTKSYVHAVLQDLGKYYGEYETADEDGKLAIKNVIKIRFAEFDSELIKSYSLRNWFVELRGY